MSAFPPLLLSPREFLERGLKFVTSRQNLRKSTADFEFKAHYGADPITLAAQWYDISMTNTPAAKLRGKENSIEGFRSFMIAHFYLWTYPKMQKFSAANSIPVTDIVVESTCRDGLVRSLH